MRDCRSGADASGAAVALVIGEDEVASGTVGVKPLRQDGGQQAVALGDVAEAIAPYLRDR